MHRCFFLPLPPNLVLSLQLTHEPQSSLVHAEQVIQPLFLMVGAPSEVQITSLVTLSEKIPHV